MPVEIRIGDALTELRKMPSESVDLVLTSPPYYGLRDYGTATWEGGDSTCEHRSPTMREGRNETREALAGSVATNSAQLLLAHRSACGKCGAIKVDAQLGLEPTLGEHIEALVELFEEVRRILKPHGSMFLNYGDCYATAPNGRSAADTKADGADDRTFRDKPMSTIGGGIKSKDLLMIPNRLAIALCDAGWWVRSEIVWGKTNPMPDSSGSQRPSTAHEKIFWLAKSDDAPIWRARDTGELSFAPDLSERCALITKPHETGTRWIKIGTYYDANAVLQGRAGDEDAATYRGGSYVGGEPGPRQVVGNKRVRGRSTSGRHTLGDALPEKQRRCAETMPSVARSRRSAGFNDRWDEQEARKGRAVTPRHEGHINHTGMETLGRDEGRFLRNYEPAALPVWEISIEPFKGAHFATFPTELARRAILAGCPIGGTVLDPFGGAGTTGLVAGRLQRNAILIELNAEYAEMARNRIAADLIEVKADIPQSAPLGPLFEAMG